MESKTVTPLDVAKLIADKNIVALFQGRSEAGYRALGNRSILYDPRDPNGKDHVNVVKRREWYRPFAASVMLEHVHDWFDMRGLNDSPFMMFAVDVKENKKKLIPCVTHVDGTCRIQTVAQEQNFSFYNLINEFYNLTSVPMIFNTSFNLAGEVIVETEDEAIDVLQRSKIEYLYIPDKQKLIINKN
jgi:carbamoyltransferase